MGATPAETGHTSFVLLSDAAFGGVTDLTAGLDYAFPEGWCSLCIISLSLPQLQLLALCLPRWSVFLNGFAPVPLLTPLQFFF